MLCHEERTPGRRPRLRPSALAAARLLVLVLVLVLVLSLLCPVASNNAKPPDATKLRTNLSRLRSLEAKNNFKQQSTQKAQAFAPRSFGEKADKDKQQQSQHQQSSSISTIEYSVERGDRPVFQLFVRRRQTGPWFRYQDLQASGGEEGAAIKATCESILLNGGLEAEGLRTQLDSYLIARIFTSEGDAGGAATAAAATVLCNLQINRIKGSLPQFKKMRPKDLEIGYRLAAEGEEICSLTDIADALNVAAAPPSQPAVAADMLDVSALLALNRENGNGKGGNLAASPSLLLLQERVAAFARGAFFSTLASDYSADPTFSLDLDREPLVDLYLCSDGSALACPGGGWQDASAGVYATWVRRHPVESHGESTVLRLRISDVAPVVESPFDAELVAGLAAATLARSVLSSSGLRGGVVGNVVLLTDSKTLVRACRTGPEGNPELAKRASQRLVLWNMLMTLQERLERPLLVQWTSGHPERRGGRGASATATDDWSFEDVAIWEADAIAANRVKAHGGGEEGNESSNVDAKDDARIVSCIELKELLVLSSCLCV